MKAKLLYANNLCRACAKKLKTPKNSDKADRSMNIFETPGLAKKLSACISIEVATNDKYSHYLCQCCSQKVNEFFHFREMCKESLLHFEELLRYEESWDFEDEIPISVFNEQHNVITVAEADFLEDTNGENEHLTNTVKNRVKNAVKKKYVKSRKDERKSQAPDYGESFVDAQNVGVSTDYSLDFNVGESSCSNSYSNAGNKACQSDIKSDYGTRAKSNHMRPNTSKVETKKCAGYRCDICSTRFTVEHRLIAHKRQHEGLSPYPCPRKDCLKSFNRWNCLSMHLRQHEERFEYACDQNGCNKVYKHKPTLVMHQRKCHELGPALKSHVCEICGKLCKTTTILNDHRNTHIDKSERPHACDQPNCLRRFANKEKLRVHLMRHAGIKNYVCPHCGMRKTTMNELKVHINYHTLERTWPCRFCTHVCNSAGNLKTHVRTVHERAKDYACRHCDRTFAKPDTRKYHEMTHTGEKPNECPECGKRFIQPAALRTHRKIHQRQRAHLETAGKLASNEALAGHMEQKNSVETVRAPLQIKL